MAFRLADHKLFIIREDPKEYERIAAAQQRKYWLVAYLQEDRKGLRAKAAYISSPYWTVYGPDVIATYDGNLWAKGGHGSREIFDTLSDLFAHKSLDLPILDTSNFKAL